MSQSNHHEILGSLFLIAAILASSMHYQLATLLLAIGSGSHFILAIYYAFTDDE